MSEQKNDRKTKQLLVEKEEKTSDKNLQKIKQRLDELKKKGLLIDVPICPECKSVNLQRITSSMGDMSGHLGWLPVMYECLDCGWRGRLEIIATNKPQNWKEVAIMAEARDLEE